MKIDQTITIAAPAEDVWAVVGRRFGDIGAWASTIARSELTADGDARACTVADVPGTGELVERLTSYDDASRALTYTAQRGLPAFVTSARNRWTVAPLTATSSRVSVAAQAELAGIARLVGPLLRVGLMVLGIRTLRELRYYVERGVPTRRKLRQLAGRGAIAVQVRRTIPAPLAQVWAAVADAGAYARFAPGIASTAIVSGAGEGMVRACSDAFGGGWSETCTLWDDGHRYRMTVDTSTYPAYYRALIGELSQTWSVEPAAIGTTVTLRFEGRVKLGILGAIAARLLGRRSRLEAILDAYQRELALTASLS